MIDKFELNKFNFPNLPCPHDCIVKKIEIFDDYLIFIFEDDLSYHDSIKYNYLNTKSLIIKYHLTDDFEVHKWKRKVSLFSGEGYLLISNEEFISMAKTNLEYLYHNVGYNSLIIKLWSQGNIILDLNTDYIEYHWILK